MCSIPCRYAKTSEGGRPDLGGPASPVRPIVGMTKAVEEKERVIIRFAGDSGDGMQHRRSLRNATAVLGNDLATLPTSRPRSAPRRHGARGLRLPDPFASEDITTPGDHPDVLIAMNPAALKADLHTVGRGGTVIVNEDSFTQRNIEKAGFDSDPLDDGTLDGYRCSACR